MGYISRPKITPDYVNQQSPTKNTNSMAEKGTEPGTMPVTEVVMADDTPRNAVSKTWTRQYQNRQNSGDYKSMDKPAKDAK